MIQKFKLIALAGASLLCAPAFGDNPAPSMAQPGAVNYVEGSVSLQGQVLNPKSVGSTELSPGQEITTEKGKAEILLIPGVFFRLDDNSAAKMISPDLTHTQIELEHGRAAVEVDEIHDQNQLDVLDAGVPTQLVKNGFYEFDANQPEVLVFDGKAAVEVADGKYRTVKSHHEFALAAAGPEDKPLAKEKPVNFNTNEAKDDFYNWSSLRSQYLAEANNQIAGQYVGAAGFAPGWYWDPGFWGYTYIGWDPFFSPFGWGFYPFGWGGWWGTPVGVWYGSHWHHGGAYHGPYRGPAGHIYHGYRGMPGGFRGRAPGGIHGGGDFGGHAGGMGGGFHGGGAFHGGGHR
jgi:hypothetical protein